jgi:hypothetical protein
MSGFSQARDLLDSASISTDARAAVLAVLQSSEATLPPLTIEERSAWARALLAVADFLLSPAAEPKPESEVSAPPAEKLEEEEEEEFVLTQSEFEVWKQTKAPEQPPVQAEPEPEPEPEVEAEVGEKSEDQVPTEEPAEQETSESATEEPEPAPIEKPPVADDFEDFVIDEVIEE